MRSSRAGFTLFHACSTSLKRLRRLLFSSRSFALSRLLLPLLFSVISDALRGEKPPRACCWKHAVDTSGQVYRTPALLSEQELCSKGPWSPHHAASAAVGGWGGNGCFLKCFASRTLLSRELTKRFNLFL